MKFRFILGLLLVCVVMAKVPETYSFWHGRWNKYVILQNVPTNTNNNAGGSNQDVAGGGGGGGGGGGSGGGVRVNNHIHLHLSNAQWEAIQAIAQTNAQASAQTTRSRVDATLVQTEAPMHYAPQNNPNEATHYYPQQQYIQTEAPPVPGYYDQANAQEYAQSQAPSDASMY